jgi:hypothetical protein
VGSPHGLPDVASRQATGWAATAMWWNGRWRGWWATAGLQIRYERRADILVAFLHLASALIYLKSLNRTKV